MLWVGSEREYREVLVVIIVAIWVLESEPNDLE